MNIINKQQTRTFHRLVKGSSLNALVREMGLEPIRRRHTHLKRACLPIPALAHMGGLFQTACLLYRTAPGMSRANLRVFRFFTRYLHPHCLADGISPAWPVRREYDAVLC